MFLSKKLKITALLAVVVLAVMAIVTPVNAQKKNTDVKKSSSGLPCPTPTPVKTAREPATWRGFYAGGYAGYDTDRSNVTTTTVYDRAGYFFITDVPAVNAAGHQKVYPKGFIGGGTVGYNFQRGHFVAGPEADFGSMLTNDTASTTADYPAFLVRPTGNLPTSPDGCIIVGNSPNSPSGSSCNPTFTITQTVKTQWLFTGRGRAGFAAGKAFIYGTGGIAITDINYSATFSDTDAFARESGGIKKIKEGWIAGAGAEFKFGSRASFKGEYLYAVFGPITTTSTNLTATTFVMVARPGGPDAPSAPLTFYPTNVFTHTADLKLNIFRVGFNYHF